MIQTYLLLVVAVMEGVVILKISISLRFTDIMIGALMVVRVRPFVVLNVPLIAPPKERTSMNSPVSDCK